MLRPRALVPLFHTLAPTTPLKRERSEWWVGEKEAEEGHTQAECHKSVKNADFPTDPAFLSSLRWLSVTLKICKIWLCKLTAVKKVVVQSWLHTQNLSVNLNLCCFLDSLYLELSSVRINRPKPNTTQMWKIFLIPDMDILNCYMHFMLHYTVLHYSFFASLYHSFLLKRAKAEKKPHTDGNYTQINIVMFRSCWKSRSKTKE